MTFAGHRRHEKEYGYLSYNHYVVLSLEQVNSLVCIVTEELGTRGLTVPFLFFSLALDVNSSGVRRPVQALFVPVFRSPRWMLSTHGTRRPALAASPPTQS
jgi:hypothetical protein